ncbi:hypothetical protein ABNG02_09405 [Halorubrum ejinorense]|uniref:Uncharacterized protein n=1 Tax=Halorubrum ejinorense TaxID=425309 RepID=A0AAV3SP71_9EURY
MTRRLTRREALMAGGAAALGALAGCSGVGNEPRFWTDPPALAVDAVPNAFDASPPERPRVVPVDFDPEATGAFADRVERLLRPIPEPLTAETLPNGEIREQIETERAAARETLPVSGESSVPLLAAERYATARKHAAAAVGTWAAVTVEGDPEAVAPAIGSVRRRAYETLESLPGAASDPMAGAAVYGPIERWYDESRRRTLVGGNTGPAGRANPIRTGEAVGDVERVQSYVEAGRHLRDRYRASLAASEPVGDALRRAAERIGAEIGETLREAHGEDVDRIRSNPGAEAFLDERPIPEDAPSVSLLSNALYRTFEDLRFDPIPVDDYVPDHPATAFTRTLLARARFRGIDAIASRIESGETMFPANADAVAEARDDAIESAAALAASESPLDRWLAAQFLRAFAEPDADLASEDRSARGVARAYASYRWIETVTSESRTVTESVADAFES